jgi:phage gpG-like protein
VNQAGVQVTGAQAARARVAKVGVRGGDIRDSSYRVRSVYRRAQIERFARHGRGEWPALHESTIDTKRRLGATGGPMVRTGALEKALTRPKASGQVDERKRDELVFGTTLPYARFHDEGRGVTRRPLMTFTPRERHDMAKALETYIAQGRK